MKNPDAPQLWLENLRNACNRSEYFHPKHFRRELILVESFAVTDATSMNS